MVLACPSTERQLNERSTASARMSWRSLAQTGASVSRKPSIVAIRGPIIAAPLARPRSVTSRPPIVCRQRDDLGPGVGRHDRRGGGLESRRRRARARRRPAPGPASIRSIGSWWPITPVEATRTCSGRQPRSAAAAARPCAGRWPALRAGRRVGVARVDHDGADVLGRQPLAAPLHRRGTDPVGGERPGRRAGTVGRQDGQVERPRGLEPRLDRRGAEAARDRPMSSPSLIASRLPDRCSAESRPIVAWTRADVERFVADHRAV